ncbi:MAG: HD domain-containing phosphohydrolase [Planctomycetota bacterium]
MCAWSDPFLSDEDDRRLSDKLAEFGLLAWNYQAGEVVSLTNLTPAINQWSESPEILGAVGLAVTEHEGEKSQLWLDQFHLFLIPRMQQGRLVGRLVLMSRDGGQPHTKMLESLCHRADIDFDSFMREIGELPERTSKQVDEIAGMLAWAVEEHERSCKHRGTIVSVTEELTASFEELALLYALRTTMEDVRHPTRTVIQVCRKLTEMSSFRWALARFASDQAIASRLSGELIVTGTPAHPRGELRLVADLLASEMDRLEREERVFAGGPRNTRVGEIVAFPIRSGNCVAGVLVAQHSERDIQYTSNEIKVLESAAASLSVVLDNASLYEQQSAMFLGILEALTASIDAKDPYTRGHSQRVADLAMELARKAGLSPDECERVHISGLVHDIGKIGVSEAVLRKTGKLTNEEYDEIKRHPEIGYRILRDIPNFEDILEGVLSHHEKFDGGGYPQNLAGNEIPLVARVIGLADAFDAMSSTRTYRQAMSRQDVIAEIMRCAGTHFDPDLVKHFMTIDLSAYDEALARDAAFGEEEDQQQAA